jgi:hypothetical protein
MVDYNMESQDGPRFNLKSYYPMITIDIYTFVARVQVLERFLCSKRFDAFSSL